MDIVRLTHQWFKRY